MASRRKEPNGFPRRYERDDYERRYLAAVRHHAASGVYYRDNAVLDIHEVGVHRDGARTWATIAFRSPDRPRATFARALIAWWEHRSTALLDPSWDASLALTHIEEILGARWWGLPPEPARDVVTWLHPQRVPPWKFVSDAEDPDRVDWERRWRQRIGDLLSSRPPAGVEIGEPQLFDHRGTTHSLVRFRLHEWPGLTFAVTGRVWGGYPLPRGPEERAERTLERLHQVHREPLDRRGTVELDGITWGSTGPPPWFRERTPR